MTDRIEDLRHKLNKIVANSGWNSTYSKEDTMDFCYDNDVTRAEAEQMHKDKSIFNEFKESLQEILNDYDREDEGYRAFKFADEIVDGEDDDWIDWYYEDRKLRQDDRQN